MTQIVHEKLYVVVVQLGHPASSPRAPLSWGYDSYRLQRATATPPFYHLSGCRWLLAEPAIPGVHGILITLCSSGGRDG